MRTFPKRTLTLPLALAALSAGCAVETLAPCEGEECENLDERGNAIMGGTTAPADAWPSAVGIWDRDVTEFPVCGGSLVHPRWVLSAKHCLAETTLSNLQLVLGTRDISGTTSGQRFTPRRAIEHPTLDLVLFELPSRVVYRTTDWVTSGELTTLASMQPATAVGWGFTAGGYVAGAPTPLLQQVELSYRGRGSACNGFFPSMSVPSSEVCLGTGDGVRDTCDGDSGNGAFFRFGGMWKALSVVKSGGTGIGAGSWCAIAGRPSLFTIPDAAWLKTNLPSAEGRLRVERSDGLGDTTLQSTKSSVSSHADLVVSGQFATGALDDVLLYDARAGSFTVQQASDTAALTPLKPQTGLPIGLTLIARGRINTDVYDDLIVFDAPNRRLQAYAANANGTGVFTALGNGLVVADSSLRNLVVGRFDSDSNLDFMTYSPSRGEGRFYEVSATGTISLVKANTGWNTDWEIILAGNFNAEPFDELVFYAPRTGLARFWTTDGAGSTKSKFKETTWSRDWQFILAGSFGGNSFTDLFYYNPRSGLARSCSTDGNGNAATLKDETWAKTWTRLIAGRFGGTSHTDVVLYDRWGR